MRPFLVALTLSVGLTWSSAAHAECKAAYTPDALVGDLGLALTALRASELPRMGEVAKRLEDNLVCLGRSAPPPVYANAYRLIGAYAYLGKNNEAEARRWFRVALEIDPSHDWDATELPLGHPLREIYESERDPAAAGLTPIEGMVIVKPAGSSLLLDGRPLDQAEARVDRPHIVQQVAADGSSRGSFRIDGNAIPKQFLRSAAEVGDPNAPAPEEKKGKKKKKDAAAQDDSYAVMTVERVRPKEKTPLLLTGALGVLGGGGVYALAYGARQQFETATTTADLESKASLTNTLVLTSGAVAAVGLGVGYWGVILDGGSPGLHWGVGF